MQGHPRFKVTSPRPYWIRVHDGGGGTQKADVVLKGGCMNSIVYISSKYGWTRGGIKKLCGRQMCVYFPWEPFVKISPDAPKTSAFHLPSISHSDQIRKVEMHFWEWPLNGLLGRPPCCSHRQGVNKRLWMGIIIQVAICEFDATLKAKIWQPKLDCPPL